jgi:phosphate:Na+ symporter
MIVNVTTVLLLLPFTGLLARLIVRLVGEGPRPEGSGELAVELNPVLLDMPPLAIDAARRELFELGKRVGDLLDAAVPAILDGRNDAVDTWAMEEQRINRHHAAIVDFLEQVLLLDRAPDISRSAIDLVEAADYLEAIADLVDKEMIPLYRRHLERGTEIDPQARERLRALADAVGQELRRALRAVSASDQTLARSVLDSKSQVRSLERAAVEFQIESQTADGAQRLLPNALERELTESIRRTYSLVRRFVRVGTGLPRIDTEESTEREGA